MASCGPLAPLVDYVVPTFGWQRQTERNLKQSVRFEGGLRVYLERPWFSSGDGALLGVKPSTQSSGVPAGLVRWSGTIDFTETPESGQYRLVILEYESLSSNHTDRRGPDRRPDEQDGHQRLGMIAEGRIALAPRTGRGSTSAPPLRG